MEEFFTRRKVVATALCTALAVSGLSMGSTAVMADDNVKLQSLIQKTNFRHSGKNWQRNMRKQQVLKLKYL